MASSYNSPYQMNGEGEFSKLAQTIGTNIQKISQNGKRNSAPNIN